MRRPHFNIFTGLLILSMNITDGTGLKVNHEYALNISCKTAGMLLLEKRLLLLFTSIPINGSISTGSTQKRMANYLKPSSAVISTEPVETTKAELENKGYSTKTTQTIKKNVLHTSRTKWKAIHVSYNCVSRSFYLVRNVEITPDIHGLDFGIGYYLPNRHTITFIPRRSI